MCADVTLKFLREKSHVEIWNFDSKAPRKKIFLMTSFEHKYHSFEKVRGTGKWGKNEKLHSSGWAK